MIVYEKNNKLNINFENSVTKSPNISIGEEDNKTKILIDGEPLDDSSLTPESLLETVENMTEENIDQLREDILPEASISDAGKSLMVDENGKYYLSNSVALNATLIIS
jgi:hypothetical protein